MKELSPQELEEYFKSDKSDWYTKDSEEQKKWDTDKVSIFWQRIRTYKTSKEDYNFEEYVFPKFEEEGHHSIVLYAEKNNELNHLIFTSVNFFSDSICETRHFSKLANFNSAIFLGEVNFGYYTFEGIADFASAEFHEYASFSKSEFNDICYFQNTIFYKDVVFTYLEFKKELNANQAEFNGSVFFIDSVFEKADFWGVGFKKQVIYSSLIFSKKVSFNNSYCEQDVNFSSVLFEGKVDFSSINNSSNTSFYEVLFVKKVNFSYANFRGELKIYLSFFLDECNFKHNKLSKLNFIDLNKLIDKEEYYLSKEIDMSSEFNKRLKNLPESPQILFEDISFNTNTSFTRINLQEVEFNNCDISIIKFSRCEWKVNNTRLVLKNENSDYKDSEIHYRHLKKNFDSDKNWEYSGYAYISEMEMRKKRLWKEKKYLDWLIYRFYDFFGGYTQDYKKPIVSLFMLVLAFSILYFFIDFNSLKAIQRGFKGALPYIQIDTENAFTGYWLILRNIEFLLGSTFLAFFILALRKRFKQ